MGTLLGAQLSSQYNVRFIARNAAKMAHMRATNNKLTITQLYNANKTVEYQIGGVVPAGEVGDISMLVVCVKTFDTVRALRPLLSKLTPASQVLLVQNGMGVLEDLYSELWPEVSERPVLYQGVIGHGVWQDPALAHTYDYNHAGFSNMKFCRLPVEGQHTTGELEETPFTRALCAMDLNVFHVTYAELLQYQIQKLMVNCCMNSVTSIIDCVNGELEHIPANRALFTAIVEEGMRIMHKAYPELPSASEAPTLDPATLVAFVENMGFTVNGKNSSSMRQDVLNLRDVEVDYINGFVVSKARALGLEAPVNETIRQLVLTRLEIYRNRGGPFLAPN